MKAIEGYEGHYSVDETGQVFSHKGKNIRRLRAGLTTKGYEQVTLSLNGKGKFHRVHRLVAKAYLPDWNEDLEVDHIDGDKENNNVSNLRMVSSNGNKWNAKHGAKGYSFNKQVGKFQARIRINRKLKYLGCYDTEEEAHKAYVEAREKRNKMIGRNK